MNRINKIFYNPKLHQKMFILIPTDNFLGQDIKEMKKIRLTDPVTSYFWQIFQLEEEPLVNSLKLRNKFFNISCFKSNGKFL